MCGLFGFFGHRPDRDVLAQAAVLAAKRGPDGWGLVTDVASERGLGRLVHAIARCIEAERFAIGHCRLATVPGTKTLAACQPLQVGRYVIAHNGTIANVADLVEAFGFRLTTGNDSEAIGHLLCRLPGSTEDRLSAALDTIDHGGHYAMAVLDAELGTIHLRANGIPLWAYRTPDGIYWCSIKAGDDWEGVRG